MLRPIQLDAQLIHEAETKACALHRIWLSLGDMEKQNEEVLSQVPIVGTNLQFQRNLISTEIKKILAPYKLERAIQLQTELAERKKILMDGIKKKVACIRLKNFWFDTWNLILLARLYEINICSSVYTHMQDMHLIIFRVLNTEVEWSKGGYENIVYLPNMKKEFTFTFEPEAYFENLNWNWDEKIEDDFIQTELDMVRNEIETMTDILIPIEEGKQMEMDLDLEGQYPDTFIGELSWC